MKTGKHLIDANKYMEDAKTELSKANWWFNRIDKYKAIELMKKAGITFALIPDYLKSANAYFQILQLIINSPELYIDLTIHKIALLYLEMCNKAKIHIDNSIIDLINNKIIPYLQETKSYRTVNNLLEEISINCDIFGNTDESIKYYQKILGNSELHNDISTKLKILNKMAELNISSNKNTIASDNYMNCAKIALLIPSLKIVVRYYLLYSLILVLDEISEEQMNEKIIEYTDMYPMFSNSPEYNLINGLTIAYKVKNVEYIKQVIINNLKNFDTHIIKVLEELKNKVMN